MTDPFVSAVVSTDLAFTRTSVHRERSVATTGGWASEVRDRQHPTHGHRDESRVKGGLMEHPTPEFQTADTV